MIILAGRSVTRNVQKKQYEGESWEDISIQQKMMIMSAKAIVAIGGIAYWLCYGMFKIKRGNIEMHEFVLVWVFLILYLTRDLFR